MQNIFAGLLLTCLWQVAFSQYLLDPALNPVAGIAGWGSPGFPGPYNTMASYGGTGSGDISVAGEMPVAGNTLIVGQVPVSGNVRFSGGIPSRAVFSVSGSCSCGLNGAIIS